MGPARMIVESLTPRPGIREQYRHKADIRTVAAIAAFGVKRTQLVDLPWQSGNGRVAARRILSTTAGRSREINPKFRDFGAKMGKAYESIVTGIA